MRSPRVSTPCCDSKIPGCIPLHRFRPRWLSLAMAVPVHPLREPTGGVTLLLTAFAKSRKLVLEGRALHPQSSKRQTDAK